VPARIVRAPRMPPPPSPKPDARRPRGGIRPSVAVIGALLLAISVAGLVRMGAAAFGSAGGGEAGWNPLAGLRDDGAEEEDDRRARRARRARPDGGVGTVSVIGDPEGARAGGDGAEDSEEDAVDPQLQAMRRSYRLASDAGAGRLPFEPVHLRGELFSVEGDRALEAGGSCDVRVLPVRTRAFNCLVRVRCGGELLYPNPEQTAGYVPCRMGDDGAPTFAHDDGVTARDGDPRLFFDRRRGMIEVSDRGDGVEAFRAILRLDGSGA
jgi:hypothetical protein